MNRTYDPRKSVHEAASERDTSQTKRKPLTLGRETVRVARVKSGIKTGGGATSTEECSARV